MPFTESTLLAANLVAGKLPFQIRQGEYSTFTFDLRTGTRLSNAPMRIEEVSRALNSAAQGSFEMPLEGLSNEWPTWVAPRKTGICVLRDRVPIWSGIIWAHAPTDDHQAVRIVAETFESYLGRRWLVQDYLFDGVDQSTIVKTLLDDAFALLGGNIRITVPTPPATGQLVEQDYQFTEFKTLLEPISQMSDASTGFDFTIDTALDASDQTVHTFRLGYPRLGVGAPGDVGSLVWQYPGSIVEPPAWPLEGRDSATEVVVIGAGEGDSMLYDVETNTVEIASGYPIVQRREEHKDIILEEELARQATRFLKDSGGERTVPEFTVLAGVDPTIGGYGLGDWARVRVDTPYLRGVYDGAGADHYGRLTGWTLRPGLAGGTSGVETVTPRLHEIVEAT